MEIPQFMRLDFAKANLFRFYHGHKDFISIFQGRINITPTSNISPTGSS